jgi:ATP dependent DNA ligase domain
MGSSAGVIRDGKTSFGLIQTASGNAAAVVFFLFDLLYLDGEAINDAPLRERKERLRNLLSSVGAPLHYSDHQIGRGSEFYAKAYELSLEGIISKRADAPYSRRRAVMIRPLPFFGSGSLPPAVWPKPNSRPISQQIALNRTCAGSMPSLKR